HRPLANVNFLPGKTIKMVHLHPAQNWRRAIGARIEQNCPQLFQRQGILSLISGTKALEVSETARVNNVHYAPEIAELVLDRSSRKPYGKVRVQGLGSAGQKGRRGFDLLHLVKDDATKRNNGEAQMIVT